ncbi:Protein of unknown function [Pyronema omphalodes CBS 100304]|uniref:Uncharacterized protein n=1 Tax=Pyronema omphalodes (strain CBS 100304) TaxID=1076935 RepID=U4KTY4_PYROM|nr:Protein of unknown function [Pyronema omphalodes CBS 100304]
MIRAQFSSSASRSLKS